MRNSRPGVAAAAMLAVVAATSVAHAQPRTPAQSFEQLQRRLHRGDAVAVDVTDGRTVVGQVLDVSPAWLDLATADATMRFEEANVRRVRLRDPIDDEKVKRGALLGAGAVLFCLRFAWCRPWKSGDLTLGSLIGAWTMIGGGAVGGAITAAAIDARHMPTLFVSPATAPPASRRSVGIAVTVRF